VTKLLAIFISLLIAASGFAQIPKAKKNTYVNDNAGVLTPSEVKALNVQIHKLERLSSVQLAIVLVDKVPEEYDIEEFAYLIGRRWHVGANNKKGVIYVAAIQQRKQRLEVTKILRDKLSDERCMEVLDLIKPYFKQRDYNGGLQAMTDELSRSLISREQKAVSAQAGVPADVQAVTAASQQAKSIDNNSSDNQTSEAFAEFVVTLLFLGIPACFIAWVVRRFIRSSRESKEEAAKPKRQLRAGGVIDDSDDGDYSYTPSVSGRRISRQSIPHHQEDRVGVGR
jgi:uncharacterized protein